MYQIPSSCYFVVCVDEVVVVQEKKELLFTDMRAFEMKFPHSWYYIYMRHTQKKTQENVTKHNAGRQESF